MAHESQQTALVIGGTGPTGVPLVLGLVERGAQVTMLHTGRHEDPQIPAVVEHVHADPFDIGAVQGALGARTFDVGLIMYGRLRDLAGPIGARVGKLITVGGAPAVRGYGDPQLLVPTGMPAPTLEDAPAVDASTGEAGNEKAAKIAETEETVLTTVATATHFRYPLIYGPRQLLPREWLIVRRILDGRRRIIVPDAGLQLRSAAFVDNAAHAVLLAVEQPEASAGQLYHVSDSWTPTLRQVVEIVASAVGADIEIVSMPYELATPSHPMTMLNGTFHRYMPSTKLAEQLGYRDVVPVADALARTARWLVANPHESGGTIERNLQDHFDYPAEDALIAAWRAAVGGVAAAADAADHVYVDRYSSDYEAARARRRARRIAGE
ncbi:MAG: NAD-dependent dehydratase [Ilumatobacteraceae bacterium]